jgi:hypothetical protein
VCCALGRAFTHDAAFLQISIIDVLAQMYAAHVRVCIVFTHTLSASSAVAISYTALTQSQDMNRII